MLLFSKPDLKLQILNSSINIHNLLSFCKLLAENKRQMTALTCLTLVTEKLRYEKKPKL